MVEREIKRWKATIDRLNTIIDSTEEMTPEQAENLRNQLEAAHDMLDTLTGDKGDKKP